MTLTDVLQTRREYAKSIFLTEEVKIDNPSGPGWLEVGGTTNAYIDLKSPFSDDFDVRLGTIGGTSATLETGNNQLLTISTGSGNIELQPSASGKVGIGTSSPADKLHISASGDNTYIGATRELLESGTSSSAAIYFGDDFPNPTAGIESSYLTSGTPSISIGVTRDGNKTRVTARYDNRIIFYTNNVANMEINPNAVRLNTLTTFANNAAAIAGGLTANDVYKTATGELRIVV